MKKFKNNRYVAGFLSLIVLFSIIVPQFPVFAAESKTYDFGLFAIDVTPKKDAFIEGKQDISFDVTPTAEILNEVTFKIGDSVKTFPTLSEQTSTIVVEGVNVASHRPEIILEIIVSDGSGNDITVTNTFNVTFEKKVKYFSISPSNKEVKIGVPLQFQTEIVYEDNSQSTDVRFVDWSTMDPSIATIDRNGVLIGKAVGSTNVSAQVGKFMTQTSVSVKEGVATIESISITPIADLGVNGKAKISVFANYTDDTSADITNLSTLEIDNHSVATIEDGFVKGVSIGEASLKASYEGFEDSVVIKIAENIKVFEFPTFQVSAKLVKTVHAAGKKTMTFHVTASEHRVDQFILKIGDASQTIGQVGYTGEEYQVVNVNNVELVEGMNTLPLELKFTDWKTNESITLTQQFPIQVITSEITKIELFPPTSDMYLYDYEHLRVYVHYNDSTFENVTDKATLTVENTDILTKRPAGAVAGVGVGQSKVFAEYNGFTAESIINVKNEQDNPFPDDNLTITTSDNKAGVSTDNQFKFTVTNKMVETINKWEQNVKFFIYFKKNTWNSNNEFDAFSMDKTNGLSSNELNFIGDATVNDFNDVHRVIIDVDNAHSLSPGDEISVLLKGVRNPLVAGNYEVAVGFQGYLDDIRALSGTFEHGATIVTIQENNVPVIPTLTIEPLETPISLTTDYTFTFKLPTDAQPAGGINPIFYLSFSSSVADSFWDLPSDLVIETEGFNIENNILYSIGEPVIVNPDSEHFLQQQLITFQSDRYLYKDDIVKITLKNVKTPSKPTVNAFADYSLRFYTTSNNVSEVVQAVDVIIRDFNFFATPKVIRDLLVFPEDATINKDDTQQYTAIAVFDDNSTEDVTNASTWSIDDTSKAVINPTTGLATGKAEGNVIVTANYQGMSDTATLKIKVTPPPPPPVKTLASLDVTPPTATINKGDTQQYRAIATYSDNSTEDVTNTSTWSVNDTTKATINATGLATGNNGGNVVVTATFNSMSDTASLEVLASPPPPPPPGGGGGGTTPEKVKGEITVKYVTLNDSILEQELKENLALGEHTLFAKTFKGYELADEKEKTVTLSDAANKQTVTFKYKEIVEPPAIEENVSGTLTIKHITREDKLLALETKEVPFGTYKAQAKQFANYLLDDVAEKIAVISKDNSVVTLTFYYKTEELPKVEEEMKPDDDVVQQAIVRQEAPIPAILGTIGIRYVDQDYKLLDEKNLTGLKLGKHTVKAKTIAGYKLQDEKEKSVFLTQKDPNQTVTFMYAKEEKENLALFGSIYGIVRDINGTPLANVRLELHSEKAVTQTDENGRYKFENVPLGEHELFIQDPETLKEIGRVKMEVNEQVFEDKTATSVKLDEVKREEQVNFIVEPITASKQLPYWPLGGLVFFTLLFRRKNVQVYQDDTKIGQKRVKAKPEIKINITRMVQNQEDMITIHLLSRIAKKLNENEIVVIYKGEEVYRYQVGQANEEMKKEGIKITFNLMRNQALKSS